MTITAGTTVSARSRHEPVSSTSAYARMNAKLETPPSFANTANAKNNNDSTNPVRDFAVRHC